MTVNEVSERYKIPVKILQEYENWGLCGEVKKIMGSWHYDDSNLKISRICMGCMGFGEAGNGQHSWTIDEEHSREITRKAWNLASISLIRQSLIKAVQASSISAERCVILQSVMML